MFQSLLVAVIRISNDFIKPRWSILDAVLKTGLKNVGEYDTIELSTGACTLKFHNKACDMDKCQNLFTHLRYLHFTNGTQNNSLSLVFSGVDSYIRIHIAGQPPESDW